MRWIWSWWGRTERDEEAYEARRESEHKLAEVVGMGREVHRVANQLSDAVDQNNFAAMVAAAFGRRS